jgi:hypothetical protein
MVVRFAPPPGCDDEADANHLDAHLLLRPGLPHPDLSDVIGDDERGLSLVGVNGDQDLRVPGRLEPAMALELEERIWEHMHFASHLRSERLGEFTIGTDLHRSDSLAIVQPGAVSPGHGAGQGGPRRRRGLDAKFTFQPRPRGRLRGERGRRSPTVPHHAAISG